MQAGYTEAKTAAEAKGFVEHEAAAGVGEDWVTVIVQSVADGESTGVLHNRTHMVEDLKPYSDYWFRVRAHNAVGWGEFSAESELIRTKRRY